MAMPSLDGLGRRSSMEQLVSTLQMKQKHDNDIPIAGGTPRGIVVAPRRPRTPDAALTRTAVQATLHTLDGHTRLADSLATTLQPRTETWKTARTAGWRGQPYRDEARKLIRQRVSPAAALSPAALRLSQSTYLTAEEVRAEREEVARKARAEWKEKTLAGYMKSRGGPKVSVMAKTYSKRRGDVKNMIKAELQRRALERITELQAGFAHSDERGRIGEEPPPRRRHGLAGRGGVGDAAGRGAPVRVVEGTSALYKGQNAKSVKSAKSTPPGVPPGGASVGGGAAAAAAAAAAAEGAVVASDASRPAAMISARSRRLQPLPS